MRLSDTGYNDVKRLVTITFPGLGSALFLISLLWEFPDVVFILGGLAILTFVGGILMVISIKRYQIAAPPYDGRIVVTNPSEDKKLYTLEVNGDVDDIDQKTSLLFEVVSQRPEEETL